MDVNGRVVVADLGLVVASRRRLILGNWLSTETRLSAYQVHVSSQMKVYCWKLELNILPPCGRHSAGALAETMRGRLLIPAVRGRCDAANGSCDRLCFRISTKSRSTEPIPDARESGRRARGDVRPGSFSRTVIAGGVVEQVSLGIPDLPRPRLRRASSI